MFVDRGKLNAEDYKDASGNLINSSPDRVQWYIEPVSNTKNGYKIYSTWSDNKGYSDGVVRNYYLSYYQGPIEEGEPQQKFLVVTTDDSQAETFYFINIDDYRNVINSQNKKYINVSGLVQDARFERNNKGIDRDGWLMGDYNTRPNNVWQFCYNRDQDTFVYPDLQHNVQELAYLTAWVGPKGDIEGKKRQLFDSENYRLEAGSLSCQLPGFLFQS